MDGIRILLVDDADDARMLGAFVLAQDGAVVIAVGSASEAVEHLQESKAQLLVSDIAMPVEDGLALIRRIRQNETPPRRIPAIAFTAFADDEDRLQALASGFDAHVSKAGGMDLLVEAIVSCAARRCSESGASRNLGGLVSASTPVDAVKLDRSWGTVWRRLGLRLPVDISLAAAYNRSRVFRHEGPSRSHAANEALAAYLALVAGFVNAVGFTLLGAFTSHVTGNVGRFGDDVARVDLPAAAFAGGLVATFFLGSVVTTLVLSVRRRRTASGYGVVLLIEATLLVAFAVAPFPEGQTSARLADLHAALLCAAMGMQNAMVTRLSGAVVRTTHLTGVITDAGIEVGRWLRWWWLRRRPGAPEKPSRAGVLLAMITMGFLIGAVGGAAAALAWQRWAVLIPAIASLAAAAQAFASERSRTT